MALKKICIIKTKLHKSYVCLDLNNSFIIGRMSILKVENTVLPTECLFSFDKKNSYRFHYLLYHFKDN